MKTNKRLPKLKIKITKTKNTITLVLDKQIVIVNKKNNLEKFEEISKVLSKRSGKREVENNFKNYLSVSKISSDRIERTDYIGTVKLKNTNNYIPQDILKKLQELENVDNQSMLSILKFWYKLDSCPSKNSREQIYRFILANNIPITEEGDIVMEKGVKEVRGVLVDIYTGTIDNSIGRIVSMPRELVEDNPNKTCSSGLHGAPPDYVRKWYSGDIVIKILVNPIDIVSVPVDYRSRKVRMCKYQVVGFSDQNSRHLTGGTVVKLSDLIEQDKILTKKAKKKTKKQVEENVTNSDNKLLENNYNFKSMTGRRIIDLIKEKFSIVITLSVKNKKGIVRKANQIVQESKIEEHFQTNEKKEEEQVKIISLPRTNQKLINVAKARLNENISRFEGKKADKKQLVVNFIEVFEKAGFKIVK